MRYERLNFDRARPTSKHWLGLGLTCLVCMGVLVMTFVFLAQSKGGNNNESEIEEPDNIQLSGPGNPADAYEGFPAVVPGEVNASNFDVGGEGVAYHQGSIAEDAPVLREGETVLGSGNRVGYITDGDWLRYTVDITASGSYSVNYQFAGNPPDPVDLAVYLELNPEGGCSSTAMGTKALGPYLTGSFTTGDWGTMQDFKGMGTFPLEKGLHRVTVCFMEASWLNFGGFELLLEGVVEDDSLLPPDAAQEQPDGTISDGSDDGEAAEEQNIRPELAGWDLDWWDEFEAGELNTDIWELVLGNGCDLGNGGGCGFGNNELQSYEADNVFLQDGDLVLEGRRETVPGRSGWPGSDYTSGKIVSRPAAGYEMRFGRLESRIKFAEGTGSWPALWLMPSPATKTDPYWYAGTYGIWPRSGEIDIVETVDDMVTVSQTIHFGDQDDGHDWTHCWHSGNNHYGRDYHDYALERSPWGDIRWFLNGDLICEFSKEDYWTAGGEDELAPFDQDFYVILNHAIGGSWPGDPTDTVFPLQARFDYVRVYSLLLLINAALPHPHIPGDQLARLAPTAGRMGKASLLGLGGWMAEPVA